MIISMIAALSDNYVIGRHNRLPWHLPDDMKFFMQTTKTHPVIMGRRNYESLPEKFRPLPNRTNLVVTSRENFNAPGCVVVKTLHEGIDRARQLDPHEIFLIGGARIYEDGLRIADRLYLTHVRALVDGDVFFPKVDWSEWREISKSHHAPDERHQFPFDFVVYERTSA